MKLKKLFLVEIVFLLLISCSTTSSVSQSSSLTPLESKDETLSALINAYKLNPDDKSTSYNLAFALASEKKFDKALKIIDEALSLHPQIVRFYTLKAYIHKELYQYNEYEKTYEKLLEIDSAHSAVALELMNHYQNMFRYSDAKRMASLVLKYDKDNQDAKDILFKDDSSLSSLSQKKEDSKSNYTYAIPTIPDLSTITFEPLPLTNR